MIYITNNKGERLELRPLHLEHKVINECLVRTAVSGNYRRFNRVTLPIRMSVERAKRYVAMNNLGKFHAAL